MFVVVAGPFSVQVSDLQAALALVVKLRRRGHDAQVRLWRAASLLAKRN